MGVGVWVNILRYTECKQKKGRGGGGGGDAGKNGYCCRDNESQSERGRVCPRWASRKLEGGASF